MPVKQTKENTNLVDAGTSCQALYFLATLNVVVDWGSECAVCENLARVPFPCISLCPQLSELGPAEVSGSSSDVGVEKPSIKTREGVWI